MRAVLPRSGVPVDSLAAVLSSVVGERIARAGRVPDPGRFNDGVLLTGSSGRSWVARVSPDPRKFPYLRFERSMLKREAALCAAVPSLRFLPDITYFDGGDLLAGPAVLVRPRIGGMNGARFINHHPGRAPSIWSHLRRVDRELPDMPYIGFSDGASHRWSEFLLGLIEGLVADIADFGLGHINLRSVSQAVEDSSSILDARPLRLCHGDLWPKNVLVREGGLRDCDSITVLDWERAFVGDPITQWLEFEGQRLTMLSIDRSPAIGESSSMDTTERQLLNAIYLGVVGLQMMAESVRNPVDLRLAERLLFSGPLRGTHS